jgi:hypothetical protein
MQLPLFPRDELQPRAFKDRQSEARVLARQLLDPDDLAPLLLDRSYDDLGRAARALMVAGDERREALAVADELTGPELETAIRDDARKAFNALVKCFGVRRIRELIAECEATNDAA